MFATTCPVQPSAIRRAVISAAALGAVATLTISSLLRPGADLDLKAPCAGVVAALDAKAGEFVQPGAVVASVADTSAWQVTTTDASSPPVTAVRSGCFAACAAETSGRS